MFVFDFYRVMHIALADCEYCRKCLLLSVSRTSTATQNCWVYRTK